MPAPTTATESFADALRQRILLGEWSIGARLPPERTLAESANLNRVTIRAALKKLEAEGLLNVRQGSGYTVLNFRTSSGPMLIAELALLGDQRSHEHQALIKDLLMLRRHLARALFERLHDTSSLNLDAVHAAIDAFAVTVEGGNGEAESASTPASQQSIVKCDLAIVEALVAASGSVVLQLCFNPVAAVLRSQPRLVAAMFENPRENVARWRGLVVALEHGMPDLTENVVAGLEVFDRSTLTHLAQLKKSLGPPKQIPEA